MAQTGRMPVIAGNWKMHHDHLVAIQVVQKLSYRLDATVDEITLENVTALDFNPVDRNLFFARLRSCVELRFRTSKCAYD